LCEEEYEFWGKNEEKLFNVSNKEVKYFRMKVPEGSYDRVLMVDRVRGWYRSLVLCMSDTSFQQIAGANVSCVDSSSNGLFSYDDIVTEDLWVGIYCIGETMCEMQMRWTYEEQKKGSLSTAAIVGIIVGGVAGCAVVACAIIFFVRRRKQRVEANEGLYDNIVGVHNEVPA
jgi:hypothetical protein